MQQSSPQTQPTTQTTSVELSDQDLVVAVRDGDEASATELYERYARRVFGLVHSRMSNWMQAATDADDIVQSVFKSLFRGIQGKDFRAPPGNTLWSLLAVIAVRKTIRKAKYHRAECRDRTRQVPLELGTDTISPDDLSGLQDLELSLAETLRELKESDQRILLARIQGYTVEEIGLQLDRTGRTVERSLQRIREKLADRLIAEDF